MKTFRGFTLDLEIVQRLAKEPNQSAVVEQALKNYFEIQMTPEEKLAMATARRDEAIIAAEKAIIEISAKKAILEQREQELSETKIDYDAERIKKAKQEKEWQQYLLDNKKEFREYPFEKWKREHGQDS